ncbi:MAG: hypothetical protein LUH14_08570 [Clostridiaceae bacterium]|nr:hypothetical protein [Clostridiaceae bacterium]
MKISFWSNVRHAAGVTANMACISVLISLGRMGRSVLLENHYSVNGIGDILLASEKIGRLRECGEYLNHYGIEYVLKRLYSGEAGDKLLHQAVIPLFFSSLNYLPQGRIVNKEVFNYEFSLVQEELFLLLESASDYVFIDTEPNQNLSSSLILSEADLIVVNLDQNPVHLKDFFSNYDSIQEKAVYLIGRYRPEAFWNISRICKEYHIARNKIGVIPYNMEMEESMLQGHLLQFLNRNYYKAADQESDYLLRYGKKAAQMIRKNILLLRREEQEKKQECTVHTDASCLSIPRVL